jgi:alpha-beta hydrolase superfamily lysophospholipase
MAEKPTVVIVPGSWQPPVFFVTLAQKLGQAGFPSEIVDLPSVGGTETPLPGLDADVAAIRKVLTKVKEEGKKTLVLSHSSGGLSGSNAIEGFDVTGIIYMSAFMIPKGKSVLEMLGGQPLPWMDLQVGSIFPRLLAQLGASWSFKLPDERHTLGTLRQY